MKCTVTPSHVCLQTEAKIRDAVEEHFASSATVTVVKGPPPIVNSPTTRARLRYDIAIAFGARADGAEASAPKGVIVEVGWYIAGGCWLCTSQSRTLAFFQCDGPHHFFDDVGYSRYTAQRNRQVDVFKVW